MKRFRLTLAAVLALVVTLVAPARAQAGGEFSDDFESGDLEGWQRYECRQDYACSVVDDPAGEGDLAARVFQRRSSPPGPNNSHRAELRLPGVPAGSEWTYQYKVYLPSEDDGGPPDDMWMNIMQLHERPTRSGESWRTPPLMIYLRDGRLEVAERVGQRVNTNLGRAPRDRWIDFVVHAKYSSGGDDGVFEVWQDGRLVMEHQGATDNDYAEGPFLSMGIYTGNGNRVPDDTSMFFDDVRVLPGRVPPKDAPATPAP